MKVLNATLHDLTQDQISALKEMGATEIENLKEVDKELFDKLSNCPSDVNELEDLAEKLIDIVVGYDVTHFPIGSPAFMFIVAETLPDFIRVIFSHSNRVSEEIKKSDGSIEKRQTFKFEKFIEL
ncbi:MAG: hypothetical protein QXZ13_02445 [Candidatus Diapherotrites archaeon]